MIHVEIQLQSHGSEFMMWDAFVTWNYVPLHSGMIGSISGPVYRSQIFTSSIDNCSSRFAE